MLFFSLIFFLILPEMWSFLLNFRFCFTANRVKIYTNQEKTRWVFPMGPVISRRFLEVKMEGSLCLWPCLSEFFVCLCFNQLCDYKGGSSQIWTFH